MADEPAGFLGRWARRKEEARQGKSLDEPAIALELALSLDGSGKAVGASGEG